MSAPETSNACADCSSCPIRERLDAAAARCPAQGARFALAAAGLFTVPALGALAGSLLFRGDASAQAAAGAGGLLAGALAVKLASIALVRTGFFSANKS